MHRKIHAGNTTGELGDVEKGLRPRGSCFSFIRREVGPCI